MVVRPVLFLVNGMDICSEGLYIVDRRGRGYTECYVKCPGGISWLFNVVSYVSDGWCRGRLKILEEQGKNSGLLRHP